MATRGTSDPGAVGGGVIRARNNGLHRVPGEPITDDHPASGVVDFARVRASAHENGGIEILGPPPFTRP